MSMLSQIIPDLKERGIVVTRTMMQEYRDAWERDGVPMDFTTMQANISDYERLLRSTGATSFGKLDSGTTLREGITNAWKNAVKTYDERAKKGEFLHTITDPMVRDHLIDPNKPLNKGIFVHKGKSARELNVGDEVILHDRVSGAAIHTSNVRSLTEAAPENTSGFAAFPPGANANTNIVTQESTPESDDNYDEYVAPDEKLLGWSGGKIEDQEYRGLSHVLGAYLTKADGELIAKNIDKDMLFDGSIAENSVELLKYMRSNGYDFNVRPDSKANQIEIAMASNRNVSLRAFDTASEGAYIGRVYDRFNEYYYNVGASKASNSKTTHNISDAIAILDYVMGNKDGRVTKSASTATSRVRLDGVAHNKPLQVKPIENRYRSYVFSGEDEAEDFIRTAIDEATLFVDDEFRLEEIQALIDETLDSEDLLITGPEFQAELEALYSNDEIVREAQERAAQFAMHSDDGGLETLQAVRDDIVGNYEDGFNPSFVTTHMKETERSNEREAMISALKVVKYDLDKIKGNDFAVNTIKEHMVMFDEESGKTIDEVTHPMLKHALKTVEDTLKSGGFTGESGYGSSPTARIDDNGVIRWEANRPTRTKKNPWQPISGEIGQVLVPNEHGIIETKFQGQENYGLVPGFTGYFSFEGDYEDRMSRFRAKGFEQHLGEQLRSKVTHQMTRPLDPSINNIPTTLDSSGINRLYHGDVYGKRIELDFMESNQLDTETKAAILQTLSNRVRFDNQFSDYATTSAETTANRQTANSKDTGAFSYWEVAGGENMRVLHEDLENYADLTMTGTGKTQGLIWYLTDGTEVNADGSVTPSKGILEKDGTVAPDKTALQKLPYFDKKSFNAWDRNQMSSNQLMTALRVDEKVNTALMAFGGWTFDDSYAVSKEFADRNKVFGETPNEESMEVLDRLVGGLNNGTITDPDAYLEGTGMRWTNDVLTEGSDKLTAWMEAKDSTQKMALGEELDAYLEEHGRFRPLQRGDKLSDFGGNKGTVGIVIDRNMDPDVAKSEGLDKEVRFMKANPTLDVVSAPYSMLSRHNAGVVHELMSGDVQDLVDPDTGEVFEAAMGQLNIIVTDMKVDKKTHAYSREDVLDGKGRKASGQLAWALQSKKANGILDEIYGRNDSAWSTYREYLIATGLDMKADGTIVSGYTPHAGEERHHFGHDGDVDSASFLDEIRDQGGFFDVPFPMEFKTGEKVDSIPILSASLRQDVELVDGSMRRSDFTNHYANIYEAVGEYNGATNEEDKVKAQDKAQNHFDKIQSTIIDRQFDGGHNGKHSFIRDKIMGKRMHYSATGVAIVDPRLDIGQAGMNQDMMDALDAKEGDVVMAFRDPVWRDGAIRAMTVVKDDSVHGIAINPIADKSHDMDFDGDTMGIMKFTSKAANRDLVNKFSHWANMIDHGNGKDELYFQTGMDLASAEEKAKKLGDNSPKELYEKAERLAKSDDPRLLKQAQRSLNDYSHKLFREHGFGGDFVSLKNDLTVRESFNQMVENKAKGSPGKLEEYMDYHNGNMSDKEARGIQYATGVKSDDTGLAGAFSQKLVSIMRNDNITAALESMYPLTQGTLQIKHDAQHAITVNEILTNDMNRLFRGVDLKNHKRQLTPSRFKEQLREVLTSDSKMRVEVNDKYLDGVTDALTSNGQLLPLKEAMVAKGSPMDRVAYGGGYEELKRLAAKEESLLEGEQNKQFAPFTMRNATEETKLAKKDTQRIVEQAVEPSFVEESTPEPEREDVGMAL